ncbi:DUF397 domain-containing protein [Kitasatospora sp. NBC_00315]|uniref:DUF397 domain-containing protein n=1 Tax=Kitasatospora sp. NBC_00315 TaxID=2975963 RepID=UPI003245EC9B
MTYYRNADATGFDFRASTYSGGNSENCVQCAAGAPGETAVRDSKDPGGPAHRYPAALFADFARAVGAGSLSAVGG